MHLGLLIFPTDKGIQPVELAKEAEVRGFGSLWFPEHSHIPVSRRTPWGGREGAPALPEEYWRTHDQFLALTAAAAVTERILLGTGITLVAQRDPLWLAKEVATLDQISNGRFLFGIGYGWNHEEMEHHGVDPRTRRKLVREKVLACKELWTQEEASYEGEFVSFGPSWAWPKPVQSHIPVLIGAAGTEKNFRWIARSADGWITTPRDFDIDAPVRQLQEIWAEAGRAGAPQVVALDFKPVPEKLEHWARIGVTEVLFGLPDKSVAEVGAYVERLAGKLAAMA